MPNKRKYDVTFGNQNKNNKREKLEEEEEPNFIDVDMDIFDMGNSVSVRDNHIYFYGNVNTRNAIKLNTAIKDIRKKLMNVRLDYQVDNLKIFLHINSFGGSVFAGLSIIDTIIDSEIPIVSIVEGSAASAATLISVVCSERIIKPNSFMLIHQMSSGFWGKMEEIKDEFINLKKLTKKLKGIYKKHTNIEKDKLKSLLKRDLWLDSAECLELGLVDRVE
uniref:Clp protease n=1 Tax=Mimiviridae sp. ChoanoV1 TaxID=2596887 RepID=A0A5B8IJ65_9VIRU|nr:Clp protease [Mimiviridae sp. ChoanoV1]